MILLFKILHHIWRLCSDIIMQGEIAYSQNYTTSMMNDEKIKMKTVHTDDLFLFFHGKTFRELPELDVSLGNYGPSFADEK